MSDIGVWPLLTTLEAALEVEIEEAGLPPFCFTGILPGGLVALDYCDECGKKCGMAWVRLASIREEPPEFNGGFSKCAGEFVPNIEMGMARCHQTMESDGSPMPAAYESGKAEAQMVEMEVMRRVLMCTTLDGDPERLLGLYTPFGPSGGCVGGVWTAQYQMF